MIVHLMIRVLLLLFILCLVLYGQTVGAGYFGVLFGTDNGVAVGFACFGGGVGKEGNVDDGIFANVCAVTENKVLIAADAWCVPG